MQLNVPNITITGNNNEEIVNVLQRYRKELNYLLMNLDLDNMPNVANKLTDIEGNYSIIQQEVNSILLSVGDIEGNVSSLVQTAEGLQTRVSTAEGNISTLTQTATTLQSRIETAEGNISTITQNVDDVTVAVSKKTTIGEVVNYLSVSQSGVKINANNIDLTGITRLYSPTMSDSYAEFYGSYFALVFRGEEIFRIHPDSIAGTDIYEPTGAGLRFFGGVYFNDADVYGLTVSFA
jgi:chaperonin cofactor prefoldin